MTAISNSQESSAAVAKKIKELIGPVADERSDARRLDELRRIFAAQHSLFADTSASSSQVTRKWKAYLQKQRTMFLGQLSEGVAQGKKTAVRTFWGVIASCPAFTEMRNKLVDESLLFLWLKAMTRVPRIDRGLKNMMEGEFLHQYRDVQFYAWIAIAELATEQYDAIQEQDDLSEEDLSINERLFQFLLMMPLPASQTDLDAGTYLYPSVEGDQIEDEEEEEEEDDGSDDDDENDSDDDSSNDEKEDSDDGQSEEKSQELVPEKEKKPKRRLARFRRLACHRGVMEKAWLNVMRLPLPSQALKHALQTLSSQILMKVPSPLRFADFYMNAYSSHSQSVVPLLALDGLFWLMTEEGLEFPLFYSSLYKLIQPSVFYVKYRVRFFQLLVKCLMRNEMLPAYLVAAFVKRLLRSALAAPPPGTLFSLALCSNLLRKHPECACLIHRTGTEIEDKYDHKTDDPTKCGALESSLWELHALEKHYYPAIPSLARSIGSEDPKSTPMHNMDDFLSHTYKSLFDQERKRERKRRSKTPLTFEKPKKLFTDNDVFSSILKTGSRDEC